MQNGFFLWNSYSKSVAEIFQITVAEKISFQLLDIFIFDVNIECNKNAVVFFLERNF